MSRTTTSYRQQARLVRTGPMRVWVVVLAAVLLYLPWVVDQKSFLGFEVSKHALLNMDMTQCNTTLILLVGALGLNLVTGYTGMISIGNAGFFALGAIVASSTGIKWLQLPFPLVIVLCGLAGAAVGALVGLPALRIRGIYLLLATLGFNYVMAFFFLKYQITWFGFGSVDFLQPATLFGFHLDTEIRWYYFLLGFAIAWFALTKNLLRTRQGRSLIAVRDNEIAASAAGINVAQARIIELLDLLVHDHRRRRDLRLVPRLRRHGHVHPALRDRVHRDDRDRRRGLAGRHGARDDRLATDATRARGRSRDVRGHLARAPSSGSPSGRRS